MDGKRTGQGEAVTRDGVVEVEEEARLGLHVDLHVVLCAQGTGVTQGPAANAGRCREM
jgi:hypothetical protein